MSVPYPKTAKKEAGEESLDYSPGTMARSRLPKYIFIGVLVLFGAGRANQAMEESRRGRPFAEGVKDVEREALAAHPEVAPSEALRLYHLDRMKQKSNPEIRVSSARGVVLGTYLGMRAVEWICEREGVSVPKYLAALERELGGPLQDAARPRTKEAQAYQDSQLPVLREASLTEFQASAREEQISLREACERIESNSEAIFPGSLPEETILAKSILLSEK